MHVVRIPRFLVLCGLLAAAPLFAAEPPGRDLLAGSKLVFAEAGQPDDAWEDKLPFEKEGRFKVKARWTFQADAAGFAGLTLVKPPEISTWRLNGKPVPLPGEKMRYKLVPGIAPGMLQAGENTLEAEWTQEARIRNGKLAPAEAGANAKLLGLTADQLDFQTQPVLGCADGDYFTVGCRTNLPAAVTLEVDGRKFESPAGLMHSFKADGLKPGTAYPYKIVARLPESKTEKVLGTFETRTLPSNGNWSFAALGDSRSNPKTWAGVAAAVVKAKPAFAIFSGDMVSAGSIDHLWDEEFFGMALSYFATIPTFYVPGNHDEGSPIMGTLIQFPQNPNRWTQVVGPVLLIGIDGADKWGEGTENYKWLKETLSESKEKFIFLLTHYPAWSSGPHGGSGERAVVEGRKFLMPLLKKYQATAMIAGHDHCYERSEPPDGIPVIITGGAGAPLYPKTPNAAQQNPHSKVYANKNHFCLITIDGDTARLRALTPDETVLDEIQWKARKP